MADQVRLQLDLDASNAIRTSETFANALKGIDNSTKLVNAGVKQTANTLSKKLAVSIDAVGRSAKMLASEFNNFSNKQKKINQVAVATMNDISRSAKDSKAAFNSFQMAVQGSDRVLQKAVKEANAYAAALDKLENSAEITQKQIENLGKVRENYNRALGAARAAAIGVEASRGDLPQEFSAKRAFISDIRVMENALLASQSAYASTEKQLERLYRSQTKLSDAILKTRDRLAEMDTKSETYAKLTSQLNKLDNAFLAVERRITAAENKQVAARTTTERLIARQQDLTRQLQQTDNAFSTASSALSRFDSNMKGLIQTEAVFAAQADRITAKVQEQNNARFLGGFVGTSGSSVEAFNKITKSARQALYAINAFRIAFHLTFGAIGLGKATRVVASFDQTIADMNSIIRVAGDQSLETQNQLNALKSTMEELGATSRYTTTEAGQGMIYMAQSGMSAAEIIQSASNVLDLAVASNTELSRASDIVIQTMRTFGIQAKDAWQVTDTLAMGAKASVTSIEDLSVALRYVGPIAHTMGIRIDTVTAALGTLSDSGLQASMAGTGLRRVIMEIVNPTARAQKILESMGLTMDKLDVQGLGLEQVLKNIKDANLSVGQSFAIWGARGTPALQVLMNNFDDFKKKLDVIKLESASLQGSAHLMREERENTLQGQYLAAVSAIQEFIIKFSEYLNLINGGKELLRSFAVSVREFNTDIGGTVSVLSGVGAGLISFLTIGNKSGKLIRSMKKDFDGFVEKWQRWASIKKTEANSSLQTSVTLIGTIKAKMIELIASSRGWAAVLGGITVALRGIGSLVASIASSLVVPVIIGFFTSWLTKADRAKEIMGELDTEVKMYFKDSVTYGESAKKAMDDYALSISNLGRTSNQIRMRSIENEVDDVIKNLNKLDTRMVDATWDPNLFSKSRKGVTASEILFGMPIKDLVSADTETLKKLWDQYATSGVDQTALLKSLGLENDAEVISILEEFQQAIQTLITLQEQYRVHNEHEIAIGLSKEVTKENIDQLKNLTLQERSCLEALRDFSAAIREFNGKEFGEETEKIGNKIAELRQQFNDPIADKLFTMTRKIPSFDKFFEFDPKSYEVKLKDMYQYFFDRVVNSQDSIALATLRQWGIPPEMIDKIKNDFKMLADAMIELQQVQANVKIEEIFDKAQLEESSQNLTDYGKKVQKAMLDIFSPDVLDRYVIDFNTAFSEVITKEGEFSDATANMQGIVQRALDGISNSFAVLNGVKLKGLISEMNQVMSFVDTGMKRADAKRLVDFASQWYVGSATAAEEAAKQFRETNMWPSVGDVSGEDVTKYWNYLLPEAKPVKTGPSDGTIRRTKKLFAEIENELEELRLKYDQYYTEITGGGKKDIELRKLALEQVKEAADLEAKATSLNISMSDARIAKLHQEIEAVYALRRAELERKAAQEEERAPIQAYVAQDSMYGGDSTRAQLRLAQVEARQLQADMQVLQEGSTGYYAKLEEIYAKKSEIFTLETQQAKNDLEILANYEQMFGAYEKEIEYRQKLQQLEVQRIDHLIQEKQRIIDENVVAPERIEQLRQEVELLERQKAIRENEIAVAPVSEGGRGEVNYQDAWEKWLKTLQNTYSETATYTNAIQGVFDETSTALVTFLDTGTFELQEFTRSIGIMLVELTTKMMMMKALTAFTGLFADGGQVNVQPEAYGDMVNITPRKFAGGGLLTRPTIFNTTSGTALAGEAGYEHIMPAARLSNGKWGVYAEGMNTGGNVQQIEINNYVTVESGAGSDNPEDDDRLAVTVSERLSATIRQTVQYELQNQMRSGGLLNQNGNNAW